MAESRVSLTRLGTGACLAVPTVRVRVAVFGGQRVPVLAVGFACISRGWAFTAPLVLRLRNRLKMCWVHARSVAAQVVQLKALWDGADEVDVRPAMSSYVTAVCEELPVSLGDAARHPDPASAEGRAMTRRRPALVHLGPKTFLGGRSTHGWWGTCERIAPLTPSLVVLIAEPVRSGASAAVIDRTDSHILQRTNAVGHYGV